MTWSTARQGLFRITVATIVGAIAVLCVSSALLAAIVGGTTVVVVIVDAIAQRGRRPPPCDPTDRLTVDLTRRRGP
jgi:uncharacterized membrane protein